MARILVTGGAGFIGSHVVDALIAEGHQTLVVDDLSSGSKNNLNSASEFEEVCLTSPALIKVISTFKPETVFHFAAQMNVRASVSDPSFDSRVNVSGLVNLIAGSCEAGAQKLIFASTGGAIYGEQVSFPADESHQILPESPYGISKRCGELYLDYFARKQGVSATSMRFGNVYGPRQNSKGEAGVVAIFCDRILAGEKLKVNGDGHQTRDYVFVGDVVSACIKVFQSLSGSQVYNVGTGKETSVLDIVSSLKLAAESQNIAFTGVEHGPALPGEQRRSVISAAKLESEFNWKPTVALKEGISRTLVSFLGN